MSLGVERVRTPVEARYAAKIVAADVAEAASNGVRDILRSEKVAL